MSVSEDDKRTRLVMVRHGEANAAVERIVGGHRGCTGLSERGRRQAEVLRDRLVGNEFRADVVVTSELPRAIETAEILARGLGYELDAISRFCDLCEIHPGEADGLPWDIVQERYPPPAPGETPERALSPGGETYSEFTARVARTLEGLVEEHRGRTVLVPCHGGVIEAMTLSRLGVPFRWFSDGMANTSITEWICAADGEWKLARFADAAHLEAEPSLFTTTWR